MSGAMHITRALRGRWYGRYGLARCPVHGDRKPSLSLSNGADGRLLLKCHAGCDYYAIRAELRARGLIDGASDSYRPDSIAEARRQAEERAEAEKLSAQARRIWDEAAPVAGTVAERYLRGRGITCALPETLRFSPNCWHPTAKRFPALLALVEGSDGFGIHRTYLRPDGSGKASVDPPKAMLGRVNHGAVRLTEPGHPVVVAEGVETALSLASGLLQGPATIWAALSTSGLRGLKLPWKPGRLTIAADGDKPGLEAATALARRAHAVGWKVYLLRAPEGQDWNDVLAASGMEAAS